METVQPEIIRQYFAGELSPAEKQAFEQRLQTEPEFRQEVETWAKMHHLADHFVAWEAMTRVKSVATAQQARQNRRKWLGAAAAVLLLVSIPLYLLFKSGESNPLELATQFADAYSIELGSTLGNPDPYWVEAQNAFQRGNYAESLEKLQLFHPTTAYDSVQSFVLTGFAHIQLGEFSRAEPFLTECLKIPSEKDAECHWGLALIHLAKEDIPAAKQELDWILDPKNIAPLTLKAKAAELRGKIP